LREINGLVRTHFPLSGVVLNKTPIPYFRPLIVQKLSSQMNFQKVNNLTGWIVFGIALCTYWITFEETASYWDCGEFIAVSYKLEVSHPPGAPLFMLVGRLFSFLALGDVTKVAYWINFLSVTGAAFTVLFLFWSVTLLGRKLLAIRSADIVPDGKVVALMGAGIVGSLAYAFSDSFWFSAVEAEVYAMSSFFTALVVWLILKWDVVEDEAKANRWLILLAYMIGLSIGFHLLNLLTLPALGLIYYFKKYKPSKWGIFAALAISGGLLLLINDIIIPGLPSLAGSFEVLFVNTFGLPFGSGALVFVLLLVGALILGINFSQKRNMATLNTFFLSITFILIGYASYATIIIRSNFDPPINENAPKDVMSFVRYLKREQYGSRPFLYGPYFTSELVAIEEGAPIYTKGKDKYEITDRKLEYEYAPGSETILPRAWNPEYKDSYESIIGLREGEQPTFSQNIKYMLQHQIGTMYVRYFFWNFAGRASDEQGAHWLSPADWFDKVPEQLASNRGRNNYFMIPFVLGLIGMFYQFVRDTKNFAVVGMLFFLLGVAIVIYLNSPPEEPRERDYIYAGSTYAFAFWIGLSVLALSDWLGRLFKNARTSAIAATAVGLLAPGIMVAEGWDDHNRSNRFFSVDSARNYLESCAPNAILFTGGDNDTFPLWYAQEVEGIRTDVRVVVLSYYNTDWYIDQSMRQTYESEPFPYTLSIQQYRQGGPNDYLRVAGKLNAIDAKEYIQLLSRDIPQLRSGTSNIVPSRNFVLKVDKEKVRELGFVPANMEDQIADTIFWRMTKGGLEKKDLAIMDLIVTNDWERPIYFNQTSLAQLNFDLSPYVIQEGNASRLIPVRNPYPKRDFVNTDVAYENMLTKFQFRGLDDPKVYYNEDYRGFVLNHRSALNTLAEALLNEHEAEQAGAVEVIPAEGQQPGKLEKAKTVLNFNLEKMPDAAVPYDITATTTIELYFRAGENEKAMQIANVIGKRADEMAAYIIRKKYGITLDLRRNLFILADLQRVMAENGEDEQATFYEQAYEKHVSMLENSR
jgi:hypothetical protein